MELEWRLKVQNNTKITRMLRFRQVPVVGALHCFLDTHTRTLIQQQYTRLLSLQEVVREKGRREELHLSTELGHELESGRQTA